MSKTSYQLKGEKTILDWAPKNFHKLKEANKVKIWCKVYDKKMPSKIEGSGVGGAIPVVVTYLPEVKK